MRFHLKEGLIPVRKQKGNGFSAVVAGDCCPWEQGIEIIQAGKADTILEEVTPFIDSADVRIIQFEAPLSDTDSPIDKSGPNLRCPVICRELLRNRFDVALLANNHTGDHGGEVCLRTMELLHEAGIRTVGAGANLEAASEPLFLEKNGIRLALLNFAEHEFGTATGTRAGCAGLDPDKIISAIQRARKTADVVMLVLHGGHERNPFPSPRMVKTFRSFAEAGASAVINIHTHCPEGIEIWKGCPIVYCPGNFYFPWRDLTADHLLATWWLGYLPKFHCDREGVYAMELQPYRFDNTKIYRLKETGAFFRYMNELSEPLENLERLAHLFKVWAAAGNGHQYISILRDYLNEYTADFGNRAFVRKMLPPRNIFSCESHRDMMETYLRMIENYEVEKYGGLRPEISDFQSPEFAFKYWEWMRHA